MRYLVVLGAFVTLALAATPAAYGVPLVNEYEGGTAWSCRWNPYADWNGTWWVGQFQWYDGAGNPLGVRCA